MNKTFTIAFSFIVAILVLYSGFSFYQINTLSQSDNKLYNHPFLVANASKTIQLKINDILFISRMLSDENNVAKTTSLMAKIATKHTAINENFNLIEQRYLGNKKEIIEALKLYSKWSSHYTATLNATQLKQLHQHLDVDEKLVFEQLVKTLETIYVTAETKAVEIQAQNEAYKDQSIVLWLIVTLALLSATAFIIMLVKRNVAVNQRLNKANQWIESELEDIAKIQKHLLPNSDKNIHGIDFSYIYQAMNGAGGDYIDIVNFSNNALEPDDFGVIVADVTGHGAAASVEAAMVDAILRTFKPSDPTHAPSEVLNYINQHFFTREERGRFITINIMRYLPQTQTLSYANAGHPHAYVIRDRELIKLDEGGIPLGVVKESSWQSYTCKIAKDDILFIYTDAVVEAKNPQQKEFGFERLETLLKSDFHTAKELTDDVFNALTQFTRSEEFDDDLTICAVKFIH